MKKRKYKVMAYVMSSGLWDAFGSITLESMLGFKDEALEEALNAWQALYDDQFRRYPYRFDWAGFNQAGEALAREIREKLPPDTDIVYEPSDDREFFHPEDCHGGQQAEHSPRNREIDLRERKRAMLYDKIAWGQ